MLLCQVSFRPAIAESPVAQSSLPLSSPSPQSSRFLCGQPITPPSQVFYAPLIGKTVKIVVSSTLQTAGGRLIFGELKGGTDQISFVREAG